MEAASVHSTMKGTMFNDDILDTPTGPKLTIRASKTICTQQPRTVTDEDKSYITYEETLIQVEAGSTGFCVDLNERYDYLRLVDLGKLGLQLIVNGEPIDHEGGDDVTLRAVGGSREAFVKTLRFALDTLEQVPSVR